MLTPAYPIGSERLLLRPFTPDDIDDAFAYQSREDVCRYIPYPPRTRECVAERIAPPPARSTIEESGHALLLAVQLRQIGHVIGDVMLHWASREHGTGEVGYVFSPNYVAALDRPDPLRPGLRIGPHRGIAGLVGAEPTAPEQLLVAVDDLNGGRQLVGIDPDDHPRHSVLLLHLVPVRTARWAVLLRAGAVPFRATPRHSAGGLQTDREPHTHGVSSRVESLPPDT
jgi:hypothetical protein